MNTYVLFTILLNSLFLFINCQAVASDSSSFGSHIHYDLEQENLVGYFHIGDHEEAISESTWLYVKQGLEFYKKKPPIFIILELNTPGGEVFAAQKIAEALKDIDLQYNIPVVAVINNWAISAGAMLAYSCRFIATVKGGSMGAAEPVYATETGKMETASEKMNSVLRADFANRASYYGRNPLIAEAMVDKEIILVLRDKKIVKLDSESQIILTGEHPDTVISAKGKLLTLNSEQMIEYGVADIFLPPKQLVPLSEEQLRLGIWPASKVLLFEAPFFSAIPQAVVHPYEMDWKTKFFVLLASPLVSSLLMMGLIIGGYIELNHPGLSVPGFIAALCLFFMILSSLSLEIAGWLELILLTTGIFLILLEIFVFPTFGLFGVVGGLLFLGGLFGLFMPNTSDIQFSLDNYTLNAAGHYFFKRLAWFSGSIILSLVAIIFLGRYALPKFAAFNPFILKGNEQEASLGFVAGLSKGSMPKVGTTAKVFATLRPAGKIIQDNAIFDAMSTGEYIEEGSSVRIVKAEEGTIFVKRDVKDK